MHKEQAVVIVFVFDLAQPGIVLAPISLLPSDLEEIAFGEIGAAVGRQPHAFVHPDDRREVTAARTRVTEEGGTLTVTSRLRHREGHYVWIEARVRRVLDGETGLPVEGHL